MMFSLNRNLHKFNWKIIGNIIGHVILIEGFLLILPLFVNFLYGESAGSAYIKAILICFIFGSAFISNKRKPCFLLCKRWYGCGRIIFGSYFLYLEDFLSILLKKSLVLSIVYLKLYPDLPQLVLVY